MKKFLSLIALTLALAVLMMSGLIWYLICCPANQFADTYQSVLQRKFDRLMETDGPKIIFVGGSSAGFGLDEALLEEKTGYPVVNLGLHAGFGAIVHTSLSKANINEGDIVLLGYEWGWIGETAFETLGTDLTMSAFDHRLDMYRWIPVEHYDKFLGYLFDHVDSKLNHARARGVYSSEAFDELGRMTWDRPNATMVYEGNESKYGHINLENASISQKTIDYLTEYRAFVESRGASVYFVCCPYYQGAMRSDEASATRIAQLAEELIGIAYISDPNAYAFPLEYMYDTIYHCNNLGERCRTELLIQDLIRAGIIESAQ